MLSVCESVCLSVDRFCIFLITVWYGNCSVSDRKELRRVVKTAQRIATVSLPGILLSQEGGKHQQRHSAHQLFALLPSGRLYRCVQAKTTTFRNCFFPISCLSSPQEQLQPLKSKRRSGQSRYSNYFRISHVMLCGPESLSPIHLHGERDGRNSVDNFF